jgi:5-methylcytosine-specific restriction protein A
MQNPLCEKCLQKGIITPAADIHHIDSFMNYEGLKRKETAFNIDNLESICKECHQREHN